MQLCSEIRNVTFPLIKSTTSQFHSMLLLTSHTYVLWWWTANSYVFVSTGVCDQRREIHVQRVLQQHNRWQFMRTCSDTPSCVQHNPLHESEN